MEITVCVSLHKDSASSKQGDIGHDVEWAGGIQDGEDRGCGKDHFKSVKGLLVKWHPKPGDIFPGKSSERSDNV